MAVQIRGYRQQTGTPTGLVSGGNLQNNVDPGLAGGLLDLAAGAGALMVRRKEEQEDIASASAADILTRIQRDAPRELDRLKTEAGEGGTGVVDGINAWMQQQSEAAIGSAPTEASKKFLRERLLEYGTRLDLNAYDYEQTERVSYIDSKFDESIISAGSAAASNPGMATTVIAEVRAAIESNKILTTERKREKVQSLIRSVSYQDQLAGVFRDPYAARKKFLGRLGMAEDSTAADVMQSAESAAAALEKLEAENGFKVPDDMRGDAVENLMRGGNIQVDKASGEVLFTGEGSGFEGDNFTLNNLTVPQVVELLGRADSDIAQLENEKRQRANAGKVTFDQMWQDTQVALANGDPVQLPPRNEALVFYTPEEVDVKYRQAEVAQAMAGTLKAMEGQSSDELAAVVMSPPPSGANNREATQRAYDIRRQRAAQVLAAREADPGAYVLNTSPSVKTANAAYSDAAQRAASGDASAVEQMPALLRNYIAVSMGEQARLGIANPALPKQFVETIVTDFNKNIRDNPQAAAGNLQFLATMLDGMPDTRDAIAEKVGTIGQFAMEGVAPQVVKKLWEASQIKEAQVKENLPSDVTWATLTSSVNDAFAPLSRTFGSKLALSNRYVQAGQKLAANYLATGVYTDPKDAANAAYAELFSDYNDIADSGTYRIPKGMGYDPAAVQVGLAQYVNNITGDKLMVEESGRPLEEARMAKARTVKNQAFWMNNADDSGAILYAPGGVVVKDANGLPIEVKFSDAQLMAPGSLSEKDMREIEAILQGRGM